MSTFFGHFMQSVSVLLGKFFACTDDNTIVQCLQWKLKFSRYRVLA